MKRLAEGGQVKTKGERLGMQCRVASDARGVASLSADSLILTAIGENNIALTVFFQGRTDITPGVPHEAGVRCVRGTLRRIYSASASGGAIFRPIGADPNIHTRSATVGDPIGAGESRYYFTIYRDPQAAGPCGNTSSTINLSNALEVVWDPQQARDSAPPPPRASAAFRRLRCPRDKVRVIQQTYSTTAPITAAPKTSTSRSLACEWIAEVEHAARAAHVHTR